MTKDAKEIAKAFDLIGTACMNIKEHECCGGCPFRNMCLEQEAAVEFIDLVNAATWDEFLEYADTVEFSAADLEAQRADFYRKWEAEERMIEEEYE